MTKTKKMLTALVEVSGDLNLKMERVVEFEDAYYESSDIDNIGSNSSISEESIDQ